AVRDAQEARTLFEGFVAKTRHCFQRFTIRESAVLVAEVDDVAGNGSRETRHAAQQRSGGNVHVHAYGVYAVFHHSVQGLTQAGLANVVLGLANTDGLRLNLHQLCERIPQTTRDGNGAADGDVERREFFTRDIGGGVHGSASFVDHHLLQLQFRVTLGEIGGETVGFARRGTVT